MDSICTLFTRNGLGMDNMAWGGTNTCPAINLKLSFYSYSANFAHENGQEIKYMSWRRSRTSTAIGEKQTGDGYSGTRMRQNKAQMERNMF